LNLDTEKLVGYAVLGFGLALLGFTFFAAYGAFTDPTILERFSALAPDAGPAEFLAYLIPLGILWIMGGIGGKIVSYGISLARTPQVRQ